MAFLISSIQFFFGLPLAFFCFGIHFNAILGNLPSTILTHKGKAVPLQARTGPEGSRKLRFPDFVTTAHDDGKVVSLTHPPADFTPRKYSWYSFLLEAESTPVP